MHELMIGLEQFGLSEKESKVYLAALELGETTASKIALKSGLPRTLVYDILERLIDLGIMTYAVRDAKKYFTAAHPKELARIVSEKHTAITKILPQLETIYRSEGLARPRVAIYEGIEGMKTVMNEILRSEVKEFLAYGSSRSSYEIIPAFMDEWHSERIKKKIVMKIMYNTTSETRKKLKSKQASLKYATLKLMPITLESPTATIIYANKVILQSWTKEPFAVVIESKAMADNQRKYFEELWKTAKR